MQLKIIHKEENVKKVVLISALLGAFATNVFAANTPSDVNQTKAYHSKAKTHKKTKEQTPAQ
nr:hypothetical protein [Campylobacter jejuni]